jgi:hypothetical protein
MYANAKKLLLDGSLDLDNDTLKMVLCDSGYTPDSLKHTAYSDLTDEVAESGSYKTGGITLTGKTASVDNAEEEGVLNCNNLAVTGFRVTNLQYFVLYRSGDGNPLIGYVDLETPVSYANKNLLISIDANGLLRVA